MADINVDSGRREVNIYDSADFSIDYVKKQSRGTNKINVSFYKLDNYDQTVYEKIYNFILELKESGYNINVNIKTENTKFSMQNIAQCNKLKKNLAEKGVTFSFDGGMGKDYDSRTVYLAQSKLQNLVDRIEESHLTPFEKYLYVYNFLIEKIYKENQDDLSKSRDVIATLTGEYIVCSGYAKLMERICKELNIQCKTQQCSVIGKDGEMYNHENNLVRIDDDKYNIHGWFYSDACWDHVDKESPNKKTFAYCLIPLSDKDKMLDNQIIINDDSLFYYNNLDDEFKLIDGEYYGSTFGIDYQTGDYSKIIKDLELEQKYEIEEEKVKTIYDNTFLREDAIIRLRKMFLKNNIPADVYDKKSEVPYGCSLECLIALSMKRNNDFLVNEKVKELKKFYDSDKILSFENSARTYTDNVYDELNRLIDNVQNYKEDFKWQCIDQKLVKIAMVDKVRKILDNENNRPGKAIPIDAFKSALLRVYSQKKAPGNISLKSIVENIVEETINLSEKVYKETATNCFREEIILRLLNNEMS